MFCAPEPIFYSTEGVASSFHVLRSRTHFRRYRGRQVQFSCFALPGLFSTVPSCRFQFSRFALPDPFSAVLRASAPVFMFCTPGPVFGGIVCVGLVFMFCAPEIVLGGTEGVGSSFHVLRSQTRFRRYRARQFQFSCFALPDPILAV
jgi:hypothetical protein